VYLTHGEHSGNIGVRAFYDARVEDLGPGHYVLTRQYVAA
jgi:hypothetical protein